MCFGGKEGPGFLIVSDGRCHSYMKVFLIPHKNVRDENQMTLGNGICFL